MSKLKVGDLAPEINSIDQFGQEFNSMQLLGKKWVLYFYPKDNTPGCIMEACNLRDNYHQFKALNYEIIGVSADSVRKHKNFVDKFKLPFRLLADEEKKIINDFESWGEKSFMGRKFQGILRRTFVINEEGKIEKIIDKVKTRSHSSQILTK